LVLSTFGVEASPSSGRFSRNRVGVRAADVLGMPRGSMLETRARHCSWACRARHGAVTLEPRIRA